jgi:hypothetical protein
MRGETLIFPRLNQRQMAAFLGIKANRLERATSEGRVSRVTEQWLTYERGLHSRGRKRSDVYQQPSMLEHRGLSLAH